MLKFSNLIFLRIEMTSCNLMHIYIILLFLLVNVFGLATQNNTELISLWPYPSEVKWGELSNAIQNPCVIKITSNASSELIADMTSVMSFILSKIVYPKQCPQPIIQQNYHSHHNESEALNIFTLVINIVNSSYSYPGFEINESYSMYVNETTAVIESEYYVGFVRGIATFFQLFSYDSSQNTYHINNLPIEIHDYPRFSHRGIMIESARHFHSLDVIKKIIMTMMLSKLNVLHWGLSNTESFPLFIESHPEITEYGAINEESIYYNEEMEEIQDIANSFGVRVIPEFDTPGHTLGWIEAPQWQDLNIEPMPDLPGQWEYDSCIVGILDPVNQTTYEFIEDVYNDTTNMFIDPFYHLGGDEVPTSCYNRKPSVVEFMQQNNMSGQDIENYYYAQRELVFNQFNKKKIFWWASSSYFINFDNDSVLQIWDNSQYIQPLLSNVTGVWASKNYKLLLSPEDYLYFDTGFQNLFGDQSWNIYTTWLNVYQFEPSNYYGDIIDLNNETTLIIGGEVQLWSEFVNDFNIEIKLFPRAFSFAEKMWTPAQLTNNFTTYEITERLIDFNNYLIQTGSNSEPITTGYCEYKQIQACFTN